MRVSFQKDAVIAALFKSWSLATSGGWLVENPARGQCNVTSLLLHELFGAEILKTPLPEGDHFYNRIAGERVDLTESQFAAPIAYLDIEADRAEALSGTTPEKVEALRAAFLQNFAAGRGSLLPSHPRALARGGEGSGVGGRRFNE